MKFSISYKIISITIIIKNIEINKKTDRSTITNMLLIFFNSKNRKYKANRQARVKSVLLLIKKSKHFMFYSLNFIV